jgi:uncharacterized protein (DUF305 family)
MPIAGDPVGLAPLMLEQLGQGLSRESERRPTRITKDMKRALKLLGPVALMLALGVAGCSEDDSTMPASRADDAKTDTREVAGNGIDRAFVTEMVPHHRSAVEMAELAKRHSDRTEIKQLAQAIIATQNAEIRQMQRLDRRLADAGVARRSLSMSAHEMGTHMDPAVLRGARPFDRAFLDVMITHHEGAIRMAQVQRARGKNRTVKRLARAIVAAQTTEIDQMHQWRIQWFGVSGHEHH